MLSQDPSKREAGGPAGEKAVESQQKRERCDNGGDWEIWRCYSAGFEDGGRTSEPRSIGRASRSWKRVGNEFDLWLPKSNLTGNRCSLCGSHESQGVMDAPGWNTSPFPDNNNNSKVWCYSNTCYYPKLEIMGWRLQKGEQIAQGVRAKVLAEVCLSPESSRHFLSSSCRTTPSLLLY